MYKLMDIVNLWWNDVLETADKRVENWFLMSGFTPTLLLTALYLISVYFGQYLMKCRPAFELRWPMFIYNVCLIYLNWHIFSELLFGTIGQKYNVLCQPVNFSDDPGEVRIAKALWWYYFSKVIEFMDTIFFVLRKKNNQISFLHVYHHATMFPLWWIGVKWVAGGQTFFGAFVNSFVHIVMYTYYAMAGLGSQFQKYLWWKRYLTRLQLLQFFIGMFYGFYSLVSDCRAVPRWMEYAGLFYGFTMISLFLNFYMKEYITRGAADSLLIKKEKSTNHSNGNTALLSDSKKLR